MSVKTAALWFRPYDGNDLDGGEPAADSEGRIKYVIDDVDVRVAVERSQYLDADGKLITEDYRVFLKDDIKKTLQAEFGTLDGFSAPLERGRAQAGRHRRTQGARRPA